jgi:hypothetical protein
MLVILYCKVDTTDARISSFSSGILILKILKGVISISFILEQTAIMSGQEGTTSTTN